MKREEIDNKYKWDLTKIYKNDKEWTKEFNILKVDINSISKFKGKITKNSNNLYNYLKKEEELERRLYKLFYYANFKLDEDTTNSLYQNFRGKILNLNKEFSSLLSPLNVELLSEDYKVIKNFIKENKKLEEYAFSLESMFRYKKHILSKNEEELIARLSNSLNGYSKAYESLAYSDMTFDSIKDSKGKVHELNGSNYSKYLQSSDRELRKNAFNSLFSEYNKNKNTISSLFDSYIETESELSKIKKYSSSIECSLYADNIDVSVYDNLIKTVNENLNVIHKYYNLKKILLNLKEIHLYDVYTPLIKEYSKNFSFEEAKELVFDALKPLGTEYNEALKKAFDERWIDVYYTPGKRTGAYSAGNYDTKPYLLLNYEGNLRSVSTLAHELGHSMHTYFSCKNNNYSNSSYKIFVAEVASTVNELLLCYHIINTTKDKKLKLYALNELLELFRTTIFRQTMFAEFEKNAYELKENGETLTNEVLANLYYDLNKKYFGPKVKVDELIKYEWEMIPHFYYNFYVYMYATSLSISASIAKDLLSGKKVNEYIKFLSLGGSDYPLNELKVIGIDASSSKVVEDAIKMFNDLIDEFKKTYKEVIK